MTALSDAGLNRLHLGLESGSDEILALVKKGTTKERHIRAGLKVREAGIELSEYVMPGLGGKRLSEVHVLETADALNRIDPDFIRLRTLAIPRQAPLYAEYEAGRFERCTDLGMAKEILLLLERLEGITSVVKSDHVLNLFGDLQGILPEDKEHMTDMLRRYLAMEPQRQRLYQVGRRVGIFSSLEGMDDPRAVEEVRKVYDHLGITPENIDEITSQLMTRFL